MKLPWRRESKPTLEDAVVYDPDGTPRINLGDGKSIAIKDVDYYWRYINSEGK